MIILYIEFLGKISENKIEICETNAFGGMQLFFNKIKMWTSLHVMEMHMHYKQMKIIYYKWAFFNNVDALRPINREFK